jgi:hypothetical protein
MLTSGTTNEQAEQYLLANIDKLIETIMADYFEDGVINAAR